jgi:hypothetical protein
MNERHVPEFNREGIEKRIFLALFKPEYLDNTVEVKVCTSDVQEISKAIMEYAEKCGLIKPQSSMK